MKRRIFLVLGVVIAIIAGAASPALASSHTCRFAKACFAVNGSGSRVNTVAMWLDDNNPTSSISGHVQARWRAGGVDRFKNSTEKTIGKSFYPIVLALNVTVDANTYVCGRFWHWNGSSWTLPFGDWQCILTNP